MKNRKRVRSIFLQLKAKEILGPPTVIIAILTVIWIVGYAYGWIVGGRPVFYDYETLFERWYLASFTGVMVSLVIAIIVAVVTELIDVIKGIRAFLRKIRQGWRNFLASNWREARRIDDADRAALATP